MKISEKLRIKRKDKKITQKELAQAIGISESIIYNWESGVTAIPIEYIIPLSKAFRCSPRVFLSEDDYVLDWYTENYDLHEGLCNFAVANPDIMKMVLYMVNNWDGKFDMLILMNFYYCSLSKFERSQIAHSIGMMYNFKYRDLDKDKMQDIAYKHLDMYFKEAHELAGNENKADLEKELQWLIGDKKAQVPFGKIKPQENGEDSYK